jgi:two-component system cell cycle response regulator DivK
VLLVDDEHDHVEMYQLALELAGLAVVAAYDGTNGVQLAQTLRPAAMVLDLRLPDMSGWDVIATLKSDADTRSIPIVLLTAAASPTLPRDASRAGCAACLIKPCFPDLLTRTVRSVIAGQAPTA